MTDTTTIVAVDNDRNGPGNLAGIRRDATQAAMHAWLDDQHRDTLHDDPGVDHGLATECGARRSNKTVTTADARTTAFVAVPL